MRMRKVQTIHLTFEDGSEETYECPPDTGFYRERYTYEEEADTKRYQNILFVNEVFWATRQSLNKEGSNGTARNG